jgi:hypothetical protein
MAGTYLSTDSGQSERALWIEVVLLAIADIEMEGTGRCPGPLSRGKSIWSVAKESASLTGV